MRGVPWRLLAAGLLTAFLLDLPFPLAGPLPLWRTIFAWFALVPMLVALLRIPTIPVDKPLRCSFLIGWLTGALWFGSNCYWVYNTMHVYGNMNEAMAVVCLVLFSIYLGFWFGVFALALALVRCGTLNGKHSWLAVAAIPFLWTAMEFAIARIPEFPWDQLGYSQVDNALLTQLAPWTGVYGISFLLALVNALFAAALFPRKLDARRRGAYFSFPQYCGGLGAAIAFVGCAGFVIRPPKPPASATAVLVQPNLNVDSDDVWVGADWDRHIAQFQQLAQETCKGSISGIPETQAAPAIPQCPIPPLAPSLIVWPESPAPFRDADPRFQSAIAAIVKQDQAPMIVGDVGVDEDAGHQYQIYNSASVFAVDGSLVGRYDKIHLVPFGEYVPMRQAFFFVRKLTEQLGDTSVGQSRKTFRIASSKLDSHRYGIFICYESVFGDEVRQFTRLGAEVLVNISDDGWYGDTSAPWQHLNMARMRAIENRRWILRDTNNGVTAAIDPYGTIRQSIPRHRVDALAAEFGYSSEITFYTAHGDWFAVVCALFALGITGWAMRGLLRS